MSGSDIKNNEGFKLINTSSIRVRSCISCENFDEAAEVCKTYEARPPARTIAQGCVVFVEDIPF